MYYYCFVLGVGSYSYLSLTITYTIRRVTALTRAIRPPIESDTVIVACNDLVLAVDRLNLAMQEACDRQAIAWMQAHMSNIHRDIDVSAPVNVIRGQLQSSSEGSTSFLCVFIYIIGFIFVIYTLFIFAQPLMFLL